MYCVCVCIYMCAFVYVNECVGNNWERSYIPSFIFSLCVSVCVCVVKEEASCEASKEDGLLHMREKWICRDQKRDLIVLQATGTSRKVRGVKVN